MKKLTLIFLITFSPVLLYSQKNDSTGNWSVSIHFSPYNYTYRTVKKVSNELNFDHTYKTSDQIPSSGFTGYCSVNYKIKKIYLKSGLIIDRYRYSSVMTYDTIYYKQHKVAEITHWTYYVDYILIGIPLKVEGSLKLSKHIELYAGIGGNFYFAGIYSNYDYEKDVGLGRFFSLNSTFGINIKARNMSFCIAPVYNHLLTPIVDRNTQERSSDYLFLYSTGVELGFNYTFHKKN